MRYAAVLAVMFLCSCAGEKDVTVRILSKYTLNEASVTLGGDTCVIREQAGKITAQYDGKKEEPAGPVLFRGLKGTYTVSAQGVERKYDGMLKAVKAKGEEGIVLINILPLESYTAAVCASEFEGMGFHPEFAKAAAVTVRSFTAHAKNRHAYSDFCDLTHCQQYRGADYDREKWGSAVRDTAGVILKNKKGINHYFYSACCGGALESAEEFAGKREGKCGNIREDAVNGVYLCASHRHYRWKKFVTLREINKALPEAGFEITGMKILSRTCSGRPAVFEFEGGDGRTLVVPATKFRSLFGKTHGWNVFYSNHFEIIRQGSGFMIEGRGFGHGAGLCAEGALNMARMGYGYEEILKHYFEGSDFL